MEWIEQQKQRACILFPEAAGTDGERVDVVLSAWNGVSSDHDHLIHVLRCFPELKPHASCIKLYMDTLLLVRNVPKTHRLSRKFGEDYELSVGNVFRRVTGRPLPDAHSALVDAEGEARILQDIHNEIYKVGGVGLWSDLVDRKLSTFSKAKDKLYQAQNIPVTKYTSIYFIQGMHACP